MHLWSTQRLACLGLTIPRTTVGLTRPSHSGCYEWISTESPTNLQSPEPPWLVAAMESILDFDKELDLAFLDKIVTSFYHGSGPDVPCPCSFRACVPFSSLFLHRANLLRSINSPSAFWRSFKNILMHGPEQMRYLSMHKYERRNVCSPCCHMILSAHLVRSCPVDSWEARSNPMENPPSRTSPRYSPSSHDSANHWLILGIRHFIVSLIVKNASDERTMRNEKVYINKLNLVLVEVMISSFSPTLLILLDP